jgi:hypothetical protein
MVVPAGYISLLDAVRRVAEDVDPEVMKATRPPEVAALERARKYYAARAASVSITNVVGKRYQSPPVPGAIGRGTPNYDSLSPEGRAKVDRFIAGYETASSLPHVNWTHIEERQRQAMDDARAKILQALADGILQAHLRDTHGYPHVLGPEPWCGRSAGWAMQCGMLEARLPGGVGTVVGKVELSKSALDCWWAEAMPSRAALVQESAASGGTTGARQTAPALRAADALQWMKRNIVPDRRTKRDVAVADCMRETGCTWREAVGAWGTLPNDVRGKRGTKKGN